MVSHLVSVVALALFVYYEVSLASPTNRVYLWELTLKGRVDECTTCHGRIVCEDDDAEARDGPDGRIELVAAKAPELLHRSSR